MTSLATCCYLLYSCVFFANKCELSWVVKVTVDLAWHWPCVTDNDCILAASRQGKGNGHPANASRTFPFSVYQLSTNTNRAYRGYWRRQTVQSEKKPALSVWAGDLRCSCWSWRHDDDILRRRCWTSADDVASTDNSDKSFIHVRRCCILPNLHSSRIAAPRSTALCTGCVKSSRPTLTRYNLDKRWPIFIKFSLLNL